MDSNSIRRILIADPSPVIADTIRNALCQDQNAHTYEIHVVTNGKECIELAASSHPPDLILLDLTLPLMHGIEILKRLKSSPHTANIGVIISTWRALIQDYQAVIECGADYYLIKPFSQGTISKLVESYFAGTLEPAAFPLLGIKGLSEQDFYTPSHSNTSSYIKFWGTRGSTPVSGIEYLVFGGNTPCLEISDPDSLIIIDAGVGIRPLGQEVLKSRYKEIHLIIGHTHWDHILGFPFFNPVYSSKYTIHIYSARGFGKTIEDLFKGMLDRDYFPVKLDEMQAKFIFHELQDNKPLVIGNTKIYYTYASHPGATLCFKIETNNRTIGYASDNEVLVGYHGHPNQIDSGHPLLFPYRELINFFTGCETLIHEAQYFPLEYRYKVGWGHSSISNAAVILKHCHVNNWIVTHHDPSHTDEILRRKIQMHQDVLNDCNHTCSVRMAYDGLVIPL